MISHFLSSCIAFSWHFKIPFACAILLGEYPYPRKEDYE